VEFPHRDAEIAVEVGQILNEPTVRDEQTIDLVARALFCR
jgi:hypothetical protein